MVAAVTALSDRIKIKRKAEWPDINIAPQPVLECLHGEYANGCWGGWAYAVYNYTQHHGITDETCSVYKARGWTNGADCTDLSECYTCTPDGKCNIPDAYRKYYVKSYKLFKGVDAMKQ